jgi:hypothetical protein
MKYLPIIVLLIILTITGCGKKTAEKTKETAKQKDEVQHKVLAFNLEGLTERGAKKWDVTGRSAESVSENEIKLDKIVANAYGTDGAATITADKGMYDKSKNNVRLEQNVRAVIDNTNSMGKDIFDISPGSKTTQKVTAPKTVQPAKAPAKTPAAPADNTLEEKTQKSKKTKTVITCEGEALFDYEKNKAYFNKNVKVVSDDGKIDADKISAHLDSKTKKVTEIVAEGNVKIMRGENITYSDMATYVEADKKVILTGNPKLVLYQEGGVDGALSGAPAQTDKK